MNVRLVGMYSCIDIMVIYPFGLLRTYLSFSPLQSGLHLYVLRTEYIEPFSGGNDTCSEDTWVKIYLNIKLE